MELVKQHVFGRAGYIKSIQGCSQFIGIGRFVMERKLRNGLLDSVGSEPDCFRIVGLEHKTTDELIVTRACGLLGF
jgi:hypothetical protein